MSKWPEGVPLPPKPEKPEGITEFEWLTYQNSDYRSIDPALKVRVHNAMGWKVNDVEAAEAIAIEVVEAMDKVSREQGWDKDRPVGPVVIPRLRAALRLLENEHITPQGRRILEQILDEEEKR
jgi:hypothetical protein